MRKSIIVAASTNGVIGAEGKIPWHLSDDLKRFKRLTMGHHLVMGRKTHESIGRALPSRVTMVLTRELFKDIGPDAWRFHALDVAIKHAETAGEEELFVCGGGEVYQEALPLVDRIYLTVVEREYEGDTLFSFDGLDWRRTEVEHHRLGPGPTFTFETWDRIKEGK